ncbi:MAG: DNA-methyltransferase [Fimbriimonadaceae bacterium]
MRLVFGDCGETLACPPKGVLPSRFQAAYLDPPFNTGRSFRNRAQANCYHDSQDREAHLAQLEEVCRNLRERLAETGALYVHCDWRTTAPLRLMLDRVFGPENYVNEVIWAYRTGGVPAKGFARKHDTIHLVAKNLKELRWARQTEKSYVRHKYGFGNIQLQQDEGGWFRHVAQRDVLDIHALRGNAPESVGYPTQKPQALLRRLLAPLCQPGDWVIDPFCGSGTTLAAARELQLNAVGLEASAPAMGAAVKRLAEGGPVTAYGLGALAAENAAPKLKTAEWVALDREFDRSAGFRPCEILCAKALKDESLMQNSRLYKRLAMLVYDQGGELYFMGPAGG